MLKNGERLDDLNLDGLKIIQHKERYNFTSDAVLLANFIKAKKSDSCLEIGSGSGVISILLSAKQNPKKIVCVELQHDMVEMSRRSIQLNNLCEKIEVVEGKIQDRVASFSGTEFDVVFSNPPYKKLGTSFLNKNEQIAVSRHEKELTLKQLIDSVNKLLKFGGKFYCVYDANRVAELIFELKSKKIEPKVMFFTSPSLSKNPTLVLIEACKGGKEGIKVLPTLIVNEADGTYAAQVQKIYRGK